MSTQQTSTGSAPGLAPRTIRLDPHNLDEITRRAKAADVDVSHMIRRMLAYAVRTMPQDWTPAAGASGDQDGRAARRG